MTTEVASLKVVFTGDDSQLRNSIAGVKSELNNAAGQMSGIGNQIGAGIMQGIGIGVGLGVAGLTAQIAGIGPAALKAAMSWEDAFTGVLKVVDGTAEELALLEQQLLGLSMGDSPVAGLENAAVQLAAIAEMAGQLGVAREDIVAFTETIAMLQMTTNLTGEAGATMLAQFANITGMDMANIDRLGATIVALGNAGASTEAEIVEFALRLAGAGTQAGFTEGEILALGSSMASMGLNAEAGGTAMTTVINTIATATAKGGTALDTFAKVSGTSAKSFAETWKNEPAKALTMFLDGLEDLDQATQLDILEQLELDGIRVSDTLRRMSGNVGVLTDQLTINESAWAENAALMSEAQKRAATTSAEWNKLENKINAIGIALGEKLLPAANDVIDALGGLAEAGAAILGLDLDFDVSGSQQDAQQAINDNIAGWNFQANEIGVPLAVEYTVQPGDSPWSIANAHGMTLEEFYALNPDLFGVPYIYADQKVKLSPQGMDMEFGVGGFITDIGEMNTVVSEAITTVGPLAKGMNDVSTASEKIDPTGLERIGTVLDGVDTTHLGEAAVLLGIIAAPTLASGIVATAGALVGLTVAIAPLALVGAVAMNVGGVATEIEQLGKAIRAGDVPGATKELADALGALPMEGAEQAGGFLGIDIRGGLAEWNEVANAVPVLINAMVGKVAVGFIDLQMSARDAVNDIINSFNNLDGGILDKMGINLEIKTLSNEDLEDRKQAIIDAFLGGNQAEIEVPVVPVIEDEGIDDKLAIFSGEPVTLAVNATGLDEVVEQWSALDQMGMEGIEVTVDGVTYEHINELKTAIINGTYDAVATPLVVTYSQETWFDTELLGQTIDHSTRDRETGVNVTSNIDAISAAIDTAARNRYAEITFRISEIGGQISDAFSDFGGFHADGGRPPVGKVSVVGEEGPELFIPDSAGVIVPNHDLAGITGGGSQMGSGGMSVSIQNLTLNGVQNVNQLYQELASLNRASANPAFAYGD